MDASRNNYHDNAGAKTRDTRSVQVGSIQIGGAARIVLQSMCATKTTNVADTIAQINLLQSHGADLIRLAVDSARDVDALRAIRAQTDANIVVDLQENFRLATDVAPYVQKLRYNPGHLHHDRKSLIVEDKVRYLVDTAGAHKCALRIGVNFGSLVPDSTSECSAIDAALICASEHCSMMEKFGFFNYVVSLKSSDPHLVIDANLRFSEMWPSVPLHLGVTEAGMYPEGARKTCVAFETLLAKGIGETLRVSLTLPNKDKYLEIEVAKQILAHVKDGVPYAWLNLFNGQLDCGNENETEGSRLNVISCPSCSRVENQAFVDLAYEVKRAVKFAKDHNVTIAVMGCRVNGPGETDHADLGLWCASNYVNLKRGQELIGRFSYDQVVPKLVEELKIIISK